MSYWDVDREQLFGRHRRCRSPQAYGALRDGRGLHYNGFMPYGVPRSGRSASDLWVAVAGAQRGRTVPVVSTLADRRLSGAPRAGWGSLGPRRLTTTVGTTLGGRDA